MLKREAEEEGKRLREEEAARKKRIQELKSQKLEVIVRKDEN